jgi:hypothetical protein
MCVRRRTANIAPRPSSISIIPPTKSPLPDPVTATGPSGESTGAGTTGCVSEAAADTFPLIESAVTDPVFTISPAPNADAPTVNAAVATQVALWLKPAPAPFGQLKNLRCNSGDLGYFADCQRYGT